MMTKKIKNLLLLFFIGAISFQGHSATAILIHGSVTPLQVNAKNCLRIRELGNKTTTGQCVPRGQTVEWFGEKEGDYYKVRINGAGDKYYLLHSSLLAKPGTVTTPSVTKASMILPSRQNLQAQKPRARQSQQQPTVTGTRLNQKFEYWVRKNGADLINSNPRDIGKFCPNYSTLDKEQRVQFWTAYISELSYAESEHQVRKTYKEDFKNSKGEYVLSTGLFQISLESSMGYKGCPVKKQSDLLDPDINTACSVLIMNQWVKRDKVIAQGPAGGNRGGARYWSVLRTDNNRGTLTSIQKKTTNFCNKLRRQTPTTQEEMAISSLDTMTSLNKL